jgi:N-acetylglucosaminyldiphosphoundecaprenol N-acetyl-beta-D-mannosaminyltransferase
MTAIYSNNRVDILGIRVNAQRFNDAINTLAQWASERNHRRYVCTSTVNNIMSTKDDPRVREAVNGADMVTADGMPLVWVQRQWGYPEAERVYGPDIMLALCEKTAGTGIRHFFWGGTPETVEKLATALQGRFPGLEIAGFFSPPYAPIGKSAEPETVARINQANADIVWVGLGGSKQDLWVSMYSSVLNAPLLIAVGAAFDFHAGTKEQAPRWMQRNGLEWVYRLFQEPRRLWRRYLIYNPQFIWGILGQHFQRLRQKKS